VQARDRTPWGHQIGLDTNSRCPSRTERKVIEEIMKIKIGLLTCAFCACQSCNAPDVGAPAIVRGSAEHAQTLDQVVCLEPELTSNAGGGFLQRLLDQPDRDPWIVVERHGARRTQRGTLEAFATLGNRADEPITLEARCSYYDVTGGPLESGPSQWTPLHLPPRGIVTYRLAALSSQAAHYYIEVRQPR